MSLVNTQACVWRSCSDLESCCYTSSCDILCPVWRVFILTQNRTCRHLLPGILARHVIQLPKDPINSLSTQMMVVESTKPHQTECLYLWANSVVVSKHLWPFWPLEVAGLEQRMDLDFSCLPVPLRLMGTVKLIVDQFSMKWSVPWLL